MKKFTISAVLLCFVAVSMYAQAASPPVMAAAAPADSGLARLEAPEERLQLAISSIDYPVTPGDIYQLTYRESAGTVVSRQFQVDGISLLDLGVFGKVFALNMQFYQLKQNVENMISKNYTFSTPSLSIVAPGVFRVAVRDSSARTQFVTAWGLSRISEIVARANLPTSSIRNIERISREGKSERFDLLKISSSSTEGSDPFVRPGDTLVLTRVDRKIELLGEVRRPGIYELVGNEGIRDLIEVFGEGVSRKADMERLRIYSVSDTGERIEYVSFKESYEQNSKLNNGDTVVVGDKTAKRALVWFEGAVSAPQAQPADPGSGIPASLTAGIPASLLARAGAGAGAAATPADASMNGRFSHPISEGVILSDVLREVLPSILPDADLGSAMITHPGAKGSVLVDLRPLLSGVDLSDDIVLMPNTSIFIPPLRSSISVSGAVVRPGFVPYLPGAPASYYVSLCGGFDPERSKNGTLAVYDQFGQLRSVDQALLPGDSIFVKSNVLSYVLERRSPLIISLVSFAITLVTFFGISMIQ